MQINSPIQNHIISKLKNAKSLRYSELQQKGVPNDLFNYHLQFLVKKGIIDKADDGYSLSSSGIKIVADVISDQKNLENLFKVNPLMIVSRVHDGKIQILNQIRKSNPSYGKVGVIGGVVRKGESIEDAASRKLKVETGLSANFKVVAIMRRFMYVGGELFSDVFFPITYSDSVEGDVIEDTDFGHNMWVDIDQAILNESAEFDSVVSLKKVLSAVKDGSISNMSFFYEEDTQSGDLIL